MRHLVVVVLAVCATTPALADGEEQYLSHGRIFYEEFEYAQCLVALDHALRDQPTPEQTVSIQIYSGLCHYHLGQLEDAESAFRIALRLDRAARLPPLSSPKIQRFFEEIAKELPRPIPEDEPVRVKLAPSPAPAENPAFALAPSTRTRNLLLPAGLAGGAAVSGVVGAIFGTLAKRQEAQANDDEAYDWDSVQLERSAHQSALVANVAFGVAVTAGIAAVTLYLLDQQ